jgi:hypothetical protein
VAPVAPTGIESALVSSNAGFRQLGREALGLKTAAAATANQQAFQGKEFEDTLKRFQDNNKDNFSAIQLATQAKKLIALGTNTGLNSAVTTVAKSLDGGRLTEEDFQRVYPSGGKAMELWATFQRLRNGESIEFNRQQATDLVNVLEDSAKTNVRKNAINSARVIAPRWGENPHRLAQEYLVASGLDAIPQQETTPTPARMVDGTVAKNIQQVVINGQTRYFKK